MNPIESADGVRLHAYRSPEARGRRPVLVALPLATRPSLCARALAGLAGRFDVITWEPRLILEPDTALDEPAALSIPSHVADAIAILDRLRIPRAALLGYCSGALIALHLATSHPRRFARLVLVSGAYFLKPGQCDHTQYERDVLGLAPAIARDRSQAGLIYDQLSSARRARRRDHEFGDELHLPYTNAESFYRFGVCLDHCVHGDAQQVATQVAMPALVAAGGRDDQTHPSSSAVIAAALGGRETYCDPDGDHYELCRAKPELMTRVTSFLATP